MKIKAIYGLFCLNLTLSCAACLLPSPSADKGSAPQQTELFLQQSGFDIEYVGNSIKIKNFENGKNGWFLEDSSAKYSDLYPSTGISEKELEDYIKAIEAGNLPALSEMENPEAFLRELLPDSSAPSGRETGDITLTFASECGTHYKLSDQFLAIPE